MRTLDFPSVLVPEWGKPFEQPTEAEHAQACLLPATPAPLVTVGLESAPGLNFWHCLPPHTQEATQIDRFLFPRHQRSLFLICCHHKVHNPALPSALQGFALHCPHTLPHFSENKARGRTLPVPALVCSSLEFADVPVSAPAVHPGSAAD